MQVMILMIVYKYFSELITINLDDGDIQELVLHFYEKERFGRPYCGTNGVRLVLMVSVYESPSVFPTE